MVRKTSNSKTRAKSTTKRKAKVPAKVFSESVENRIDGCDFEVLASDVTPDFALPPAKGGVEAVRATRSKSPQRRSAR